MHHPDVAEVGNVGFRVYRLGKGGEVPVSKFIPGSYFRMGDRLLLGGEYNYFDPKGSQEAAYFVESVSDKGKTKRTAYLVPTYVESIDAIPEGNQVKAETFAPKAGDNRVSQDLQITSSELKAEMQLGMLTDNPTRHKEVISTPGGVRIAAKADGLIRVTKGELQTAGFDVNSSSANWQLYLNGVELPMIMGPNSDYIEFLGKSINTLESDIRTYYLIPGNSAGKRIESRSVRPPLTNSSSKKYEQTFVREDKKIYASQILNGPAENWWGDVVTSTAFDYQFSLSGIDRTPGTRKMTVAFQGLTLTSHVVELTLNGTVLPNVGGNGALPFQGTIDVPVSALLDGTNTLKLRAAVPGGDVSLLARLAIDLPRGFVAIGDKLNFYTENYKNARLSGFSSSNVRVFDVTYEDAPTLLTNLDVVQTNGTWGPVIPAARSRVLYAVEAGAFATASSVTPLDPAILEDPSNVGTMLIISHPSLMTQANAWAAYRTGQGIQTKVIDATDIYDEFSYGLVSSQAI
ncbi:MAG TPA: C25 family cysteine peptidase, partial [Pyrinomonadaceae bacterium]|nr:C25 family cysteine peptidase [Pyrinomonadaceae bacterium]